MAPEQGSAYAGPYDLIFAAITALTILFSVIVFACVLFFAIKYRAGSKADRSRPQHENLRIEIAWSLPPMVLGILIFAWGAVMYVDLRNPPKNAMEIFVIGKQWMWHIQHPNGVREMNELHVPSGVPIKLTMISQDVIHSFYVPQFRIQYMVIPGRYTYQWFTPTKPGKYYLFCAQHCGTLHSEMGGYVYVMPPAKYAEWLAQGGSGPQQLTMQQQGEQLYTSKLNCVNCHTSTDTERGPSLYGLYGKQVKMAGGETQTADNDYMRESILNPYSHLVAGYTNTMPDYGHPAGQLTEEDIDKLLLYIKSLSAGTTPPPAGATTTTNSALTPAVTPPTPTAAQGNANPNNTNQNRSPLTR
jgi:cytochrome c oxidase subunit 2